MLCLMFTFVCSDEVMSEVTGDSVSQDCVNTDHTPPVGQNDPVLSGSGRQGQQGAEHTPDVRLEPGVQVVLLLFVVVFIDYFKADSYVDNIVAV